MFPERNRGSPKLQFSKEELDNPDLAKPIGKARKAADRYEKAQAKLPKQYRGKPTAEKVETGQNAPDTPPDPTNFVQERMEQDAAVTDASAPGVWNTRKKPDAKATKTEGMGIPSDSASEAPGVTIPGKDEAKKNTVRLQFEASQKKPTGSFA